MRFILFAAIANRKSQIANPYELEQFSNLSFKIIGKLANCQKIKGV